MRVGNQGYKPILLAYFRVTCLNGVSLLGIGDAGDAGARVVTSRTLCSMIGNLPACAPRTWVSPGDTEQVKDQRHGI